MKLKNGLRNKVLATESSVLTLATQQAKQDQVKKLVKFNLNTENTTDESHLACPK